MQAFPINLPLFGLAAAIICVLAVLLVLVKLAGRKPPGRAPIDLSIDVSALRAAGPPQDSATLECYGLPVRLAALVMAPLGRTAFPEADELIRVLDGITPGLSGVFATHETSVRRWPSQLSPRGFGHFFISQVPLPGDQGKGSPWCSVTGKVATSDGPMMIGMVLRAGESNSLGRFNFEKDTQWLEALRVREIT